MEGMEGGAPASNATESTQNEGVSAENKNTPQDKSITPEKSEGSIASSAEKAMKKFKVKIDGQESEVDESELIKGYQTSKAAMKRFEEAARKEKEHARFIEKLKANPAEVLNDPRIGKNAREWAENFLAEELRKEMMSPEQRKLMEYEAKMKEFEERERQQKEFEEQQKMSQLEAKYAEELQNKFIEILDTSDLPKSPYVVKKMASLMYAAMQEGIDADITPEMYVRVVRDELKKDFNDMIRSLDGDKLLAFLGEDTLGKVRKADIARVKSGGMQNNVKKPEIPINTNASKKKLTMDEFREMLDKD